MKRQQERKAAMRDLSREAVRSRISKLYDEWKYDEAIAFAKENDVPSERTHVPLTEATLAKQADATIKHLISKGLSFDQAATVAHRAEAVEKSRTAPATTARYYQSRPGDNGDGMDDVDWNDPVAASKAHRAEQAAKAQSRQGSHQDENTRPRRRQTSANLNPKPLSP
jgi:hypothetical protein